MDIYDRLREGVDELIQKTDKRIEDIKRSPSNTPYETIELELRGSVSRLLKLIRSDAPNNTANEMSNELRHQRAKESLEHCINLTYSNKILGNTFVADSDLIYALNLEKKFLDEMPSSDVDKKCLYLSDRLNELANYVLETNNINILE